MCPNARKKKARKIVVTGDVAVDWFEVSTPSPESYTPDGDYQYNWENYQGNHTITAGQTVVALSRNLTISVSLSQFLNNHT